MSESTGQTPDDVMRKLSSGDQNDTALQNLAHMAFILWTAFVGEGLSPEVATQLTVGWVCEVVKTAKT